METEQFQLDGKRFYCSYECLEVDAKDSSESGENDVFLNKVKYFNSNSVCNKQTYNAFILNKLSYL